MAITLHTIIDAVETTLSTAVTIIRSQTFDKLTEGINSADTPLLQVYPEAFDGNMSAGSETDKLTLQGNPPVRRGRYTIIADYYPRQRSHIDEDMAAVVAGLDAMTNVLEAQVCKTPFGIPKGNVRSFQWNWRRVVFEYAGAMYLGFRFTLVLEVF